MVFLQFFHPPSNTNLKSLHPEEVGWADKSKKVVQYCFVFSVARFVANFLPVRYLQMNHRRMGSVSMVVLCVAPVLAYLTTHRICDFQQFCPDTNVQVRPQAEREDLFLAL